VLVTHDPEEAALLADEILDPEFIALWPAGDEFRARQPS
jgi:hypothetical protein